MLDLFEFGVTNYKSLEDFATAEISRDLKPIILFQGEQFEFSEKHMRLKNLFYGKYITINMGVYRLLPYE